MKKKRTSAGGRYTPPGRTSSSEVHGPHRPTVHCPHHGPVPGITPAEALALVVRARLAEGSRTT